MATIAEISVDINANLDGLRKGLAEANKRLDDLDKNVGKSTSSSQKGFESLGTTIKGVFAVEVLKDFAQTLVGVGKGIVLTSAEFEKLGAVLANTFGSKTQGAIAQIGLQQLAQELPSSLQEVTGAFLKLQNAGINPSIEDMRAFSDVAANAGKGIDQFAEAINDAARGEFERLKEFFIDASKQGDKIIFSFKGQKVAIDNNSDAIKAYLVGLGQVPGVLGAAGVQMDTVSGKISNMGDAFDNFANIIGKSNRGIIASSLDFITEKVNALANALLSVEDRGLAQAASGIKKQFESLQEDFNTTAKNAKANGKDVKAALDELAATNLTRFLEEFGKAKDALDAFEAENGGTLNQVGRNLNNFTESGAEAQRKYEQQLAKLSGNVELYKAILNELPNIQDKATKSLEPLTNKTVDLRNSLEIVNDELEKYYKILGNPDATNAAVANAAKQIRINEQLRDSYQEVIDARVKQLIPKDLQNLTGISQGQQALKGLPAGGGSIIDPDRFFSPEALEKIKQRFGDFKTELDTHGLDIVNAAQGIQNGLAGAFEGLGEIIGSALAGSLDSMGGAFNAILGLVASFMKQFGAALIAAGVAALAFENLALSPPAAIVAGIALIAAAAAVNSLLQKGPAKASGAPPLATGTNYMPGDGLAYLHKGEAVVPKKYNPYLTGNGGGMGGEVIFTIYGDTLKGVLNANDRRRDRTG